MKSLGTKEAEARDRTRSIPHDAGVPLIVDNTVATPLLCPVFEYGAIHHFTSCTSTKIGLAVVAVVVGGIGIAIAVAAWLQKRISTDKLEPEFLANAMYVDATYAKVVGGPGQVAFDKMAEADQKVVDGVVNGAGRLVQRVGTFIQPGQSGQLRQYAIGVALGGVALVIWLLTGAL